MRIQIVGTGFPGRSWGPGPQRPEGRHGIADGVQRRGKPAELLGVVPGDAAGATWELEATVRPAPAGAGLTDLTGPYLQGPPGGRFIYLSWVTADATGSLTMFRRAKLWLDGGVPPEVLASAVERGTLVGRLSLSDEAGGPLCASVRPPLIEWSAAG